MMIEPSFGFLMLQRQAWGLGRRMPGGRDNTVNALQM